MAENWNPDESRDAPVDRGRAGDEVRGIAHDEDRDDEFEDVDDLDEEDDEDETQV